MPSNPLIGTQHSRAYTTFGGPDIKAVIDGETFMYLLALGYSVTREKAPQYFMGNPNPVGFTRGKRGIAGTTMAAITDREPLLYLMRKKYEKIKAGGSDDPTAFGASAFFAWEDDIPMDSVDPTEMHNTTSVDVSLEAIGKKLSKVTYADQILPFDIILVAGNEYGNAAFMSITGVEVLSQSAATSLDTLTNETQYTWVATGVNPWLPSVGDRTPNPALEQVAAG